jgi:hypothetical protein
MPSLKKEDIWLRKFLAGDQIFGIGSQLATRKKIKIKPCNSFLQKGLWSG